MTDWIEHTGNTCPVDPETVVAVRCSDGKVVYDMKALFWDWATKGEVWSITHYRIVTPAKPPEPEMTNPEPDLVALRLECLKLAAKEGQHLGFEDRSATVQELADSFLDYVLNGSVDKAKE